MTGDVGNKHHFTGKERDPESSNDYFGARYYNQQAGRWLAADPVREIISDPQRLNAYRYSRNDPINWIDPDGLEEDPIWPDWFSDPPYFPRGPFFDSDEKRTVTSDTGGDAGGVGGGNKPVPKKDLDQLLADEGCAKALGFSSSKAARAALINTSMVWTDLGPPDVDWNMQTNRYTMEWQLGAWRPGSGAQLNSNPAYADLTRIPVGNDKYGNPTTGNLVAGFESQHNLTGLTPQTLWLITQAHEFGHSRGTTILPDLGKPGVTFSNWEKVIMGCFSHLKKQRTTIRRTPLRSTR